MATVEQRATATGSTNGEGIRVENPATGEIIGSVPNRSADEVAEIVARARAAQPAWEALGFAGRARVLRRAQKWVMDNSDRLIATIVSETGKTYEDAQLAEISYVASGFGFWAKAAPEYLAATGYAGGDRYVETDAVTDGLLISAGPTEPVAFAREIFRLLGAYDEHVTDAWYRLFHDSDPKAYGELRQAGAQ